MLPKESFWRILPFNNRSQLACQQHTLIWWSFSSGENDSLTLSNLVFSSSCEISKAVTPLFYQTKCSLEESSLLCSSLTPSNFDKLTQGKGLDSLSSSLTSNKQISLVVTLNTIDFVLSDCIYIFWFRSKTSDQLKYIFNILSLWALDCVVTSDRSLFLIKLVKMLESLARHDD